MQLPDADQSFYLAAAEQLDPARRPAFVERVVEILRSHPDPGPGDVDRAVRAALAELWTPPEVPKSPSRWTRQSGEYVTRLQQRGKAR